MTQKLRLKQLCLLVFFIGIAAWNFLGLPYSFAEVVRVNADSDRTQLQIEQDRNELSIQGLSGRGNISILTPEPTITPEPTVKLL